MTASENLAPPQTISKLLERVDSILDQSEISNIEYWLSATEDRASKTSENFLLAVKATLSGLYILKLSSHYETLISIVATIIAYVDDEPYFSHISLPEHPEIGHLQEDNLRNLLIYLINIKKVIQPIIDDEEGTRNRNEFLDRVETIKSKINKGFFYEFTDGDLKRIQVIVNELRELIVNSYLFDSDHQSRLLKRLERLQIELHKKMSDVDRIWGLVGDAGIAIGKFGSDAKPFVDRIKELSQIAWKTQARAEELPSSIENPLLETRNADE